MSAGASLAAARATVIVESPLAARQWEAQLARQAHDVRETVWEAAPIRPYHGWLEHLWLDVARDEPAAILTPAQSAALWRRVVAESPAGESLLGHAGAAEWAAAAASLLRRWRLEPDAQRPGRRDIDFRAFLDWERRYREALAAQGWRDRGDLEQQLLDRRVQRHETVLATDLRESYPARLALFEHLARGGTRLLDQEVPGVAGRQRSARLPDASHEARAAFAWAREWLAAKPDTKLAIVVPDLDARRDEIARIAGMELAGARAALWIDGGALARDPAVGAAVDALSLLASNASYAAFGRWLRSPFFATPGEDAARARLDRELRETLRSHVPFVAAYRHCGLRQTLAERAPLAAAALAHALAEAEGIVRAAPSRWARVWTRFLAALGWQLPPTRAALLGWQNVLDEIAGLTPILGEVTRAGALTELERIVERAPYVEPLPLAGVHVLRHIDDVGPGYAGVWALGFTDAFWPEPLRGNPLLPAPLQRQLALPYATPADAELRSAHSLARLVARTPELVVSWPARVYDYETEPSPAIAGWTTLTDGEIDGLTGWRLPPRGRARETMADEAPPFSARRLPGGTGALGRQARCPLRAFCQDRLGARALEPLRFGLDARLRGIVAHRAVELLFADLPNQAALLAKGGAALAGAAERALEETFGNARRTLRSLFQLELEQLELQITAFLRVEAQRAPFRVRAVEERRDVLLGTLELRVRVDRLDELADGTLAVLDYKTSERASGADWFAPRLRDAQVPLYAAQTSVGVGAAVIARLAANAAGYAGIWPDGAFPGRRSPGAVAGIAEQLELWRAQLADLAGEFAAGDVRILRADYADALGAYAPLTRIHEQLGIADGTSVRW